MASTLPPALDLSPIVDQVRRLLVRYISAPEFFKELAASLCSGSDDAVAAVWLMGESGSLGLYAEHRLSETGLLNDVRGTHAHQQLLVEGVLAPGPVVRSHSLSEFIRASNLLLVPIRKGSRQVGVIELFRGSEGIATGSDDVVSELEEIADCVNRFLRRLEENEKNVDPKQFLPQLLRFLNQLHDSLDLPKVHTVVANELRVLCACDRVTSLDLTADKATVRAVSGQSQFHRHSREVQSLEKIVALVSRTKQRFVFPHGESNLPEDLVRQLCEYLRESSSQMVLIEPVFDRHDVSDGEDSARTRVRRRPIAAIAFEQFDDSLPNQALLRHVDSCMPQVGLAITNAQQHTRLRRIPGLSLIGGCWQGLTRSRLALLAVLMAALIVGAWSLLAFEQEFTVNCRGFLMPVNRQRVFAPLDGEVARVFVTESEHVNAGDPLLQLLSPDLDSRSLEFTSRKRQKLKERDSILVALRGAIASQSRDQSARLQAEHEITLSEIATIEDQLELLFAEQAKLLITAPLSGTVTTHRPADHLLRKPVQRGEPLIELMSEEGPWQLELEYPERRAGHLIDHANTADVKVKYRLAAFPQSVWEGRVETISDRTILSQHYGTAVQVYCEIDEDQLPQRRIGMDVIAQVHCGSRSLMFVYFGEIKELLHRRWWL